MYKHWISNSYKIKQSKRDILSLKDIIVLHNSDIHFSHYILGNIMGRVSNFQMLSHDSNPKHSLGILKENSSILYILDCTANIYFDMQNILISIHYTYFD